MTSKIFITVSLVLIVGVSIAGFLLFQKSTEEQKLPPQTKILIEPSLAWIEVKKPKVFEISSTGETKREFKTSDVILNGMTILVDANGSAIIHFPDGSVARLEPKTKLTIDETKFESSDGTLITQINLSAGKVWSKILQLATPQSIWEVKTANAVATVRGTSFGISFAKDKTSVVGLENKVAIKLRDPKTGEIIATVAEAIVEPEKLAVIYTEEIEKIKESKKIEVMTVAAAPTEIKSEIQEWVKTNKAEDTKFEQIIKDIKKDEKFQLKLQEKILENIEKNIEIKTETNEEKPLTQELEKTEQKQPETKIKETETKEIQPPATVQTTDNITSIKIFGSFKTPVIEGEIIQFKALGITASGNQIDLTTKAIWQVIGNIGIISSGKFQAQLIGEIAEQGFGLGNIIVIWKDQSTGKEFLGASDIIRVEAAQIEEQRGLEG